MIRRISPLLLALLLTSCAMFQAATPPAPQNPRQALILAVHEATALVQTSTESYTQGLITKTQHDAIISQVEKSRAFLAKARQALDVGDLSTAQGQLEAANLIINTLRASLGGAE